MQKQFLLLLSLCLLFSTLTAQSIKWTPDGNSYYQRSGSDIVKTTLPDRTKTTLITAAQLTPEGADKPLRLRNYFFSEDGQKLLIYTNSKRVWRYDTRGDYWILDLQTNRLRQLGTAQPESSLMFAKISPDGKKVAYVSKNNLYVEDIATAEVKQLTQTNGLRKLIHGTFDWVYEEEFSCRDGFRWSPNSKQIAYWQIDANQIRDFLMINTTDSIYARTIPVEYPKVGEPPSPYRIGVADISSGKTRWMDIPGDPRNTYLPRMEWAANDTELLVQQLNRKQNESQLMLCTVKTGKARTIYTEKDDAWIDLQANGDKGYWDWLDNGKAFLWTSEKDGWRHVYRISREGKKESLLTPGNYDMISLVRVDEKNGYLYFTASPDNATQALPVPGKYERKTKGRAIVAWRPERLSWLSDITKRTIRTPFFLQLLHAQANRMGQPARPQTLAWRRRDTTKAGTAGR